MPNRGNEGKEVMSQEMRVPGTELARMRVARGLQQKELATLLGVKPSTLSSVENAHRAPWPRLRRECARLLGVEECELFPEGESVRLSVGALDSTSSSEVCN
jgi:transcriptional regulator with XRE-family HTH domain